MMTDQTMPIPRIQQVMSILWPSFLSAGLATILCFTAFDPQLIMQVSGYGDITRLGGYSTGFFIFWLLTSSSCALTCYFRLPCDTFNRKVS